MNVFLQTPKIVPLSALMVLTFISGLFWTYQVHIQRSNWNNIWVSSRLFAPKALGDYGDPVQPLNFLDGCRHVYLDVGSNIGIQVRKLFEPDLYPKSPQQIFNKVFGQIPDRDLSVICAVGFEPNPHHSKYLSRLERRYKACGWKVKFFKESAVTNRNGTTSFFSDDDHHNLEWGASLIKGKRKTILSTTDVTLIRLASFVENLVATRSIPMARHLEERSPTVLMKMDIEGSEGETIPDLALSGALKFIDYIVIEDHARMNIGTKKEQIQKSMAMLASLAQLSQELEEGHKIRMIQQDDESYHLSKMPFPNCSIAHSNAT